MVWPISRLIGRAPLALPLAISVVVGVAACAPREADLSLPRLGRGPDGGATTRGDAAADAATVIVIGEDARADERPDGPPCVLGGTSELLPVTVACAQPSPAQIVTDARNVYWAVQSGGAIVLEAPRAGGSLVALAYDSAPAVGVAVDSEFVYYTQPSRGRIMRVPIAGGLPVVLADGVDFPLFLALDAASLYWTGGATDGKVGKLNLTPGATPVTLVAGQTRPRAIAAEGGFVYWTDFVDGTVLRAANHVNGPPDGGGLDGPPDGGGLDGAPDGGGLVPVLLAAGLTSPSDLALAGGFAYVPDQAGRIVRVPLAGGALEPVTKTAGVPFGVATDGAYVYWSTLGDGGIFKTALDGAAVVVPLVTGEANPHFLAVDDIAVFWGAWGDGGAIRKIAK